MPLLTSVNKVRTNLTLACTQQRPMEARTMPLQMQNGQRQRGFLGLTGYYRNYIENFSSIAALLSDLMKKGYSRRVSWGPEQEEAHQRLKELLLQKPVMHLPDWKKPFHLRTDASNTAIGAVLLQRHNGKLFPVHHASTMSTQ